MNKLMKKLSLTLLLCIPAVAYSMEDLQVKFDADNECVRVILANREKAAQEVSRIYDEIIKIHREQIDLINKHMAKPKYRILSGPRTLNDKLIDTSTGYTAPHTVSHIHKSITDLVNKGADVNCGGYKGRTPLYNRANSLDIEGVKLLLQLGANPNIDLNPIIIYYQTNYPNRPDVVNKLQVIQQLIEEAKALPMPNSECDTDSESYRFDILSTEDMELSDESIFLLNCSHSTPYSLGQENRICGDRNIRWGRNRINSGSSGEESQDILKTIDRFYHNQYRYSPKIPNNLESECLASKSDTIPKLFLNALVCASNLWVFLPLGMYFNK